MKKNIFPLPYIGYASVSGRDIVYTQEGNFSVIIEISNPVTSFCSDEGGYFAFQELMIKLIKTLGERFILQKQDVFSARKYQGKPRTEYLQNAYDAHFQGRPYHEISTCLTITRRVDRSKFYAHDEKAFHSFLKGITKVIDLLTEAGLDPLPLNQQAMDRYIGRMLSADFSNTITGRNNLMVKDHELQIADRSVRMISLIDNDRMDLPSHIAPYRLKNDGKAMRNFAMDNFSFLHELSHYDCLIYNQVISIPQQRQTLTALALKERRHAGIPDAANKLCAEDIAALLSSVARDNQLLVHSNFNLMICASTEQIEEVTNHAESALFSMGIIPSRNAYNQMELFLSSLPGNAGALKNYDLTLLPSQAAACFFYKERYQRSDQSDFLVRFTDRKGIPVSIDLADLPMRTGRISNRSKFVLGGSGSGKSFFMNSLVEQYLLYNMDVVIVDTGHSYSGLCSYYKGKYLTYSEQKPITMNPFAFSKEEYNIEKKDFLKTLIFLLLKGVQGTISAVEDTVISGVIASFYADHFSNGEENQLLNFDVFYHYSIPQIKLVMQRDHIHFDIDAYRFVLRKFCLGQEFGQLLNFASEDSLLEEKLVVFEIDAIREHKVLFPIVTLIIMDVFLQKMRLRHHQRKALILEEAWKAIASELMASYLVYMYKTVRKFYGEAIVVTQEIEDIISSPTVKNSIIANSDTVCLLDQSKFRDDYGKIATLLSLNEAEQKKIFTINQLPNKAGRARFKEVYIKRGSEGEVYGVEVSLRQYLTFSTEKPEKLALEYYVSRYGNYPSALDAFILDFEHSGLELPAFIKKVNANS